MTVALAARVVVTAWLLAGSADGGCPFQNPFWFVEKPIVVPVKERRVSSTFKQDIYRVNLVVAVRLTLILVIHSTVCPILLGTMAESAGLHEGSI